MNMEGVRVPGDKSISHRWFIVASLAAGESRFEGVSASRDVESTIECLRALGARIDLLSGDRAHVTGPAAWRSPAAPLACGNSGTSARLRAGLIAGLGVGASLRGDDSLMARPMDRVVYPLQAMGARIAFLGTRDRLPMRVESRASGSLRPLRYRPRMSSAQVRGALLLAALVSRTDIEILDRGRPRDHTERLLAYMGAPIAVSESDEEDRVRLRASGWDGSLRPFTARVPGDVSAAAFLVAASLLAGRSLRVDDVGLNPRRTGFLQVLSSMGATVETQVRREEAGEPVGTIRVSPGPLKPFAIDAEDVPGLVDEIPLLAGMASRVPGTSSVRGADELRVKESDRLATLASNLRRLGVECTEWPDGISVTGSTRPLQGRVATEGDHRIAMTFGVLGRMPGSRIEVDDRQCVDVSFPGFWRSLQELGAGEVT